MGEGDEIDIICFNVRCFSFKMHSVQYSLYNSFAGCLCEIPEIFFFIDFKISTDEINNKSGY